MATFEADARRASATGLTEMYEWAVKRAHGADAPGPGRNAKARRMFNEMRRAAVAELDRRGLAY